MIRFLHFSLIAIVLLCLPAAGQKSKDVCPYCGNDPALMAKAGIVSHGPFEFGETDTSKAETLIAGTGVKWIESKHFRIGFALGPCKVKEEDKKKIRAELERLAQVLPKVDNKASILDPWLRVHMFAQRSEDVWNRMLEVLQVEESAFPDGTKPWNTVGKYMGEGPYLGEKSKYEVLILPNEMALTNYLRNEFGVMTRLSQRWNIVRRDAMTVVINTQQGDLRDDLPLHGHVAFNLAINMLDGYKHYSYETPIWLREGLGHLIEREVSPKHNTFDSSEGSIAEISRKEKWQPEVRKIIAAGKAPRMAELINMKDYADLTLDKHYVCWSMVDFLVQTNPKGFACLNDALHGRTNKQGFADGSNLVDAHREKFKECLGFATYQEFDAAWAAWVDANYSATQ